MKKICYILMLFILTACNNENNIYTLYRSSPLDANMRIHIATFDSSVKSYGGTQEDYNQNNCDIARDLFQNQPGVLSRFWCEKGKFKK